MEKGEKINEFINDIYSVSFYQKYGLSFLFSLILIILLIFIIYYDYFNRNIDKIRKNWENERCVPLNIPFAAHIMPPTDGKSNMDFIFENFKFCIDGIMKTAVDIAVSPIQMSVRGLTSFYKSIAESLNSLWMMIMHTRNSLFAAANKLLLNIKSIFSSLLIIILKMKDTISKTTGVISIGFHFIMTFYHNLKMFLGSFYQIIELAVAALSIIMISFFLVPFFAMWPAGIFLFTSLTLVIVFMGLYHTAISPYVKLERGIFKLPSPGSFCFAGKTKLQMFDNSYINICEIKPGDVLRNGSIVTSTFKFKNYNPKICRVGKNIWVTGEHLMCVNDKLIPVKKFHGVVIEDFSDKYIYCLNTHTKQIEIDGYVFTDYDELKNDEKKCLMERVNMNNIYEFWKYYDGGFSPNTEIQLNDGTIKRMGDVKIGDILKRNIEVLGIVNGISRTCHNYYNFCDDNGNSILCSDNIIIKTSFGRCGVSLENRYVNCKTEKKQKTNTVHFITSQQVFHIGHLSFWDFDSMTEFYLE